LDQSTRRRSSQPKRRQEASASFTSDKGEVRYPAHLRWICLRCTRSCRDLPGRRRNILLAPSDIRRITGAARLTAKEFSVPSRGRVPYERKMRKLRGRCMFLQGSRCSIYGVRPLICRFYPFFLRPARDGTFDIGFDPSCSGMGKGPHRGERFFHSLVGIANRELSSL
jgi:Fe-S-cluster containining protein